MSGLDMDAAAPLAPLPHVPPHVIMKMLQSMSLRDRFTCALVCKAWAKEATAATRRITIRNSVQDLSCLQRWLEKHGSQVEVLQLHEHYDSAVTALPCPQLHDLVLSGVDASSPYGTPGPDGSLRLDGSVWNDIASATKLTSVWLEMVQTASQQADVVSALTALPNLEQLTWSNVKCGWQCGLRTRNLLQNLTKLTALTLDYVAAAEALEHLGWLTRLQDLSFNAPSDWAAAGCPGLLELKALTRLDLSTSVGIPSSVIQLTALQRLGFSRATPTALNKLTALTGLTQLRVDRLMGLSPDSPPVQLPGLQYLDLDAVRDAEVGGRNCTMPISFLACCTQLCVLKLCGINLRPGSLVANSMLQHLDLCFCQTLCVSAADAAADPVSWQHVFPGPGQLPHLTSLKMMYLEPDLQHADMECVVSCCSSLQVLDLNELPENNASALTFLPALTSLTLKTVAMNDQQCSSLAQLTGLRELKVDEAYGVSVAGLQQLATLDQLTCLCVRNLYFDEPRPILPELFSYYLTTSLSELLFHMCAIINKVCVCGGGGGVLCAGAGVGCGSGH